MMDNGRPADAGSDNEENLVERLLEAAGSRPEIPERLKQRLAVDFRTELRSSNRRRRQRRLASSLAAAACLILALALLLAAPWKESRPAPAAVLATVARVNGDARFVGEDSEPVVQTGDRVMQDQVLRTGTNAFAVIDYRGAGLRVDRNSRLAFFGDHLELLAGRIYVDSASGLGPGTRGSRITLVAGATTIRNVGTQFSVWKRDGLVTTQLREGELRIDADGTSRSASAHSGAKRIRIESNGAVDISTIQTSGPHWDWIHSLPPAYDLEGRSIAEFLSRTCRDAGLRLLFAEQRAADHAQRTLLHGNLSPMTPVDAIHAALATTRLSAQTTAAGELEVTLE